MRFPSGDAPFSHDGEYAAGKSEIEIGVLHQPVTMLGCKPKRMNLSAPTADQTAGQTSDQTADRTPAPDSAD